MIPSPSLSIIESQKEYSENQKRWNIPINKFGLERFISSKIIVNLLRPQENGFGPVTTIAEAINTLYNYNFMPLDVSNIIGWNEESVGKRISNSLLLNGIKKVLKDLNLNGHVKIYCDKAPKLKEDIKNQKFWLKLKRELLDIESVLIYYKENNISLLAGFYEEAEEFTNYLDGKNKYLDRRDWIFIAEHSRKWINPIRCIRYKNFISEINSHKQTCLIKLSCV